MSLAIKVDIRDDARPTLERVRTVLRASQINPIVGRSGVNTFRSYLFAYNRTHPNKLGGKRTNFYAQAARGTSFTIEADGVTISIASVGIQQRYYGGVIRPKTAKFLAIPVHPKAHGKRPREMDLEVIFGEGGRPIALATKSTRAVQITQNKRGKIVKREVGRRGEIMFRLVKSVSQAPDPTVLPSMAEVARGIVTDLDKAFRSAVERKNLSAARAANRPAGGDQ